MKGICKLLCSITVIGICLWACERADAPNPNALQPTLSSIQQNIFNLDCALSGCHAGTTPQQGQNLSEGQSFNNIVNVPSMEVPSLFRVNPGNPNESYLFLKITGAPLIVGSQMPLGRPTLSAEKIEIIRQWIENGALDN